MKRLQGFALAASAVVLAACAGYAASGSQSGSYGAGGTQTAAAAPPFGGPEDTAFAADLWQSLTGAKLVGADAIISEPYEGTPPHGKILEYLESNVTVGGRSGTVIVKRNYGGKDATEESVFNDRLRYLGAVTVMYNREAGYDPDNQDWFWVKYNPDGSLQTNPKGMTLAGRIAKGAEKGCIACHGMAPGDDYLYSHDRFAQK